MRIISWRPLKAVTVTTATSRVCAAKVRIVNKQIKRGSGSFQVMSSVIDDNVLMLLYALRMSGIVFEVAC